MPNGIAAVLLLIASCGVPGAPARSGTAPPACRAPLARAFASDTTPSKGSAFEQFLGEYVAAQPERRGAMSQAFIDARRAAGGFPIVAADGSAVFVFFGTSTDHDVRLIGDFQTKAFHSVYWDEAGVRMMRATPEGELFYARLRFEADARLDYQFVVDGTARADPLNPRSIQSGVAPAPTASELVMPLHVFPDLTARADVAHGQMVTIEEAWAQPRIAIYLPPGYTPRRRYAVVYTADGSAWRDAIGLPTLLDNLIASRRIPPILAVMIDAAADRSAWYSYNPKYLTYLERVVAHVDAHYSTLSRREARLVIGTSAGGRAALYAALERSDLFGGAGLLSPSLASALYYFEPYLSRAKRPAPNLRVWLSAGTYEGSLCEDAGALERYFRSSSVALEVAYTHEGHSFGTWRSAAVGALVHLLSSERAKD